MNTISRRTILSIASTVLGATLAGVGKPFASQAKETATPTPDMGVARVRFAIGGPAGGTAIIVRLADNPTSRDFLTMLPLELTFEEFAGNEKIGYLPRELVTEGSPGTTPAPGDLIYFVPWGNLGFFYDEPTNPTYDERVILIGTIESGFDLIPDLETGIVRVEPVPAIATPAASPRG